MEPCISTICARARHRGREARRHARAADEPLAVIAIQFERRSSRPKCGARSTAPRALHRFAGKWIIAIDEDIDPANADALFWAMSYRCQPQHDLKVLDRKDPGHGPRGPRDNGESASVLINAMLKSDLSPVALPKREYMERARDLGTARPAAAEAGTAVAWLRARHLAGFAGRPGAARGEEPRSQDPCAGRPSAGPAASAINVRCRSPAKTGRRNCATTTSSALSPLSSPTTERVARSSFIFCQFSNSQRSAGLLF